MHARSSVCVVFLGLAGLLGGCATTPRGPESIAPELERAAAREVPVFFGADGSRVPWDDLVELARTVDVVIIGEQHDDGTGHFLQQALLEDVLAEAPEAALSLEMIERDEQMLVDDYLDDVARLKTFLARAGVTGWPEWEDWYQPSVDLARTHGIPVIAANAPRRYVRIARTEGFDALRAFDDERQRWFAIPDWMPDDGYRERFWEIMGGPAEVVDDATREKDERVAATYRSQSVWDATMAESIANALAEGRAPVIHFVGQFHSDFRGGLVQQLERRAPNAQIMVISMIEGGDTLDSEDTDRADFIAHTKQGAALAESRE